MIYITGDTHRDFSRIEQLCERMETTREDVMIILGDAGINFYGWQRDGYIKLHLSKLPITLFCIHGNHEMRPASIPSYEQMQWRGGMVYYEPEFDNLLFAKDGEVYDFAGKKTIVIGGAYSVDREYRVMRGFGWWADEQPSAAIKAEVEQRLEKENWTVDVVLSHTVPLKYEPVEVFLPGIDQSQVDKTTEIWLGEIEKRMQYDKWFAGHYHTEKQVERLTLMFESIRAFE